MPVIRLPSEAGHGEYDLYAEIPANMSVPEAISCANDVIRLANKEDFEDGECSDSLSVEESVQRRLTEKGFVFVELASTLDYDAYDPD